VKQPRQTQLAWYVIDDRKMYKPGEEVSLKGWLRTIDTGKNGDVGPMMAGVTNVVYKVTDSQGNEIAKGAAPVSTVGGWDTKFTLPKTPNLGHASVTFEAQGDEGQLALTVQVEVPRPGVRGPAGRQGPFLVGGTGDVTVNASYTPVVPARRACPAGTSPANRRATPPTIATTTFGTWSRGGGYDAETDEGRAVHKTARDLEPHLKTDASGAHIATSTSCR
jgi:hypothetical protein